MIAKSMAFGARNLALSRVCTERGPTRGTTTLVGRHVGPPRLSSRGLWLASLLVARRWAYHSRATSVGPPRRCSMHRVGDFTGAFHARAHLVHGSRIGRPCVGPPRVHGGPCTTVRTAGCRTVSGHGRMWDSRAGEEQGSPMRSLLLIWGLPAIRFASDSYHNLVPIKPINLTVIWTVLSFGQWGPLPPWFY